jgi:hypothetical protein
MSWTLKGLKAGAISGLILSIALTPLNFYVHNTFAREISEALGTSYEYTVAFALQSALQNFALFTVAGLFYAVFYNGLPGRHAFTKALVPGTSLYFLTLTITFLIDFHVSKNLFYIINLLNIPVLLLIFPSLLSKFY